MLKLTAGEDLAGGRSAGMPLEHPSRESFYRTRWRIVHHWLPALVHAEKSLQSVELAKLWNEYLTELSVAIEVAAKPA